MIERVDHIEVVSPDLDRSIDFYTRVLGFRLTRRVAYPADGAGRRREIAYLTLGEVMLEFLGDDGSAKERAPNQVGVKLVALRVDDMARTLKGLREHGVEPSWGPNPGSSFDGLRAEVKDPHGNAIELREWRSGDSAGNLEWKPAKPGLEKID